MKNSLTKTALLISLLLLFPALSLAGEFKVTRVYDGDTVKAEGHDIKFRI